MHQIASTIVSFFLSPVDWISILLLVSFFIKKNISKKYCRVSALFIFLIFSNGWLLNWYAIKWQPQPRDISADKPYSCAILLGGFASPDANDEGYFNSSSDRFIQAVKVYKMGKAQHIIVCGGNGKIKKKAFNEAAWTKGELNTFGIPDSAILFEDRSANTADNAVNAKRMLDSIGLRPPYLLITSAYHMPRASLIFKKAGVDVIAFPGNYIAGKDGYTLDGIIPSVNVLLTWDFYLKETAGYFIYSIKK